jgi:hypothetical protein
VNEAVTIIAVHVSPYRSRSHLLTKLSRHRKRRASLASHSYYSSEWLSGSGL